MASVFSRNETTNDPFLTSYVPYPSPNKVGRIVSGYALFGASGLTGVLSTVGVDISFHQYRPTQSRKVSEKSLDFGNQGTPAVPLWEQASIKARLLGVLLGQSLPRPASGKCTRHLHRLQAAVRSPTPGWRSGSKSPVPVRHALPKRWWAGTG